MNVWSPVRRFRSCARSLKRFGEALKRRKRSSEDRFEGFARARAHPPIPPRGVRSSDAPGFRSCARAPAKRSSEESDPTHLAALAGIATTSPPAEMSTQPMTELTIPTTPIAASVDHRCRARSAVLSVLSERRVLSVVSGVASVEDLSVLSVLSSRHIAADHRFRQFCQFRHRCMLARSVGFVSYVKAINGSPLKSAAIQRRGNSSETTLTQDNAPLSDFLDWRAARRVAT